MSDKTAAIVGSASLELAVAHQLVQHGYRVDVFRGPGTPFARAAVCRENPLIGQQPGLSATRGHPPSHIYGGLHSNLDNERFMLVGGSATSWQGLTLRMLPNDFKTKSLYRLRPGLAARLLGSRAVLLPCRGTAGRIGTDADNPFAPSRSQPYPLPPFSLSYGDTLIAEKLRAVGLVFTRRRRRGRATPTTDDRRARTSVCAV